MNRESFEKGLNTRREVLGSEYVENSIKNADDFNRPMQELVTEYCWHEIWNRPGLDRRTRSIMNLCMLTALNRPHELKLHVRGAINNTLSYTQAMSYTAVKSVLSINMPNNDGVFRCIEVHVPEGTVLNPIEPAAVGVRPRSRVSTMAR